MLFESKALKLKKEEGILHLMIDLEGQGANVIGQTFLKDLNDVLPIIEKDKDAIGVVSYSLKPSGFIFGADITEFQGIFSKGAQQIESWLNEVNTLFNRIEDLSIPSVAVIEGFVLGGGLEYALSFDYRFAGSKAKVGLPETQLGIMPGWSGTIRLPRLIGEDTALEWVTTGKHYKAEDAMKVHAIDAVLVENSLDQALNWIKEIHHKKIDFKVRKEAKKTPLNFTKPEFLMSSQVAKGVIMNAAGPHYPAPMKVLDVMNEVMYLQREDAQKVEAKAFSQLTQTPQADALVTLFMNDQMLKKKSKAWAKKAKNENKKVAVLGAGIMGGGIAYQTASRGLPILMKDINDEALQIGLKEAQSLALKNIKRKKWDEASALSKLSLISPTLSYGDMKHCDLVVEAVVENINVKKQVLKELEQECNENTIIASNTSTISISLLQKEMKRPEKFCGIHFFNPVHRMPLVEVIRGEKTSDETIAQACAYVLSIGKSPVVVNDCPGFLVNRVLFPYFNGFNILMNRGADFLKVDKVMESWGMPMGPSYLLDVVGIDTAHHAASIMADSFDRMKMSNKTVVEQMFDEKRFGQKNSLGFYKYEVDRKGRPKKVIDENVPALLSKVVKAKAQNFDDEEIIMSMLLPMLFEAVRCLDEKIVETYAEADMSLLMGIGFPPFRLGIFKWAQTTGLDKIKEWSDKLSEFGELYQMPQSLVEMQSKGDVFYK